MLSDWPALSVSRSEDKSKRIRRNSRLLPLVTSLILMSGSFCHLFPQTELSGAGKLGLQSTLSLQGLGKSVTYAHSALTFEPNLGQDPSSARFISYGQGYVLRLESDKASLALRNQSRSSLPAPVAPTIALDFVADRSEEARGGTMAKTPPPGLQPGRAEAAGRAQ